MTPLISTLFALVAFHTLSVPTIEPKGPYSSSLLARIGVVEVQPVQALDTSEKPVQKKLEKVQVEQYEKIVKIEQSENSGQLATISAYTGVETCKNTACIMANGKRAHIGAAACPRRLKLGTIVTIEGLGDFVCSDRTAKRYDGRYDLFLGYEQTDYQRALQFGIQKRKVTIK